MTIADAADLHTTWAARFNAKDLDGMVALAEPASLFVPQPGVVVEGEAVRAAWPPARGSAGMPWSHSFHSHRYKEWRRSRALSRAGGALK